MGYLLTPADNPTFGGNVYNQYALPTAYLTTLSGTSVQNTVQELADMQASILQFTLGAVKQIHSSIVGFI